MPPGCMTRGKVAVSSKILNKIGQLSENEFAIMREHSTLALRHT